MRGERGAGPLGHGAIGAEFWWRRPLARWSGTEPVGSTVHGVSPSSTNEKQPAIYRRYLGTRPENDRGASCGGTRRR